MREPRRGSALRSVRVRLTLVAVLATAVAVTSAGWLLVRSVEDTQTARVRESAEGVLDDVVARLEAGASPTEAARLATAAAADGSDPAALAPTFVQIVGAEGDILGVGPLLPGSEGAQLAVRIDGDGGVAVSATRPHEEIGDARANEGGADPGTPTTTPAPGDGPAGTTQPDADARRDIDTRLTLVGANALFAFEPEHLTRSVTTPAGDELTVVAAAPVDEVQENLAAVRRALWVGVPALVATVAVVAWYLVGRALRPVEAIRAEVAAIGGTTIHRRVPEPGGDDEIGRLAHTMNRMLDRLETAADRQRQFVSDASHELRSPVAAIRTDVEVALREGDRADWSAVGTAVLAEEARLERLLDDLLTLASADESGGAPRPDERVDVDDLVADVAARPRRVPVRWARRVGATEHDELTVAGRGDDLARMLTNLVDNAVRHADGGVDVGVDLASSPSGTKVVHLVVDDDGPGIPDPDRRRVFDRFTRLDDGRARDGGGAGLGLAVVRSIAMSHRGRVWVDDAPGGGARVVVELPLAPDGPMRDGRRAGP